MKLKKSFALLLTLVMLAGLMAVPVQAAGIPAENGLTLHTAETEQMERSIAPRWINTDYIVHGIQIGSGGRSTITVSYNTYSRTDKIEGTATLQQQNSSGSWSDITSWSFSGTGSARLSKTYTVSSGSYRIKTTGSVYTSSGSFVEQVTVYSQRQTY